MQHQERRSQLQTNCASLLPAERRRILGEAFRLIINAHRRSLEANEVAQRTHDAGHCDSTDSAVNGDLVSGATPERRRMESTAEEVTS